MRRTNRTKRSWARLSKLMVAFMCAVAALLPAPAQAHAIVRTTEPRIDETLEHPPERVVMHFNEPVEIAFGAIRVFDTNGNRVDEDDADYLPGRADAVAVSLEPHLPRGTYTVTWRVISADSHPIEEAFVFHVGAPGARPQGIATEILSGEVGAGRLPGLLLGIARWMNFVGLLLLVGAITFVALVWRRSAHAVGADDEADASFLGRWRKIVIGASIAVIVATLASFYLQGVVAADVPLGHLSSHLWAQVIETRFGKVMIAKLILLIAAAILWFVARRTLTAMEPRSVGAAVQPRALPRWIAISAAVVALGLLVTPAVSGHAGTTSPVALSVGVDTIHLLAAAAWIGGLAVLLVAAFPAFRAKSDHPKIRMAAAVVSRFSDMAVIAVAVIVATGVYAAWLQVQALRALTGATYGVVLLAKIGAFLPLLALGAVNNRWTKPRIVRAADDEAPSAAPLRTLRRLVTVEVVIAAIVLALTAFLVNLPPAKVEAGVVGPFQATATVGENELRLVVDPNKVGENEIHLFFNAPSGMAVHMKEVRVLFRMPEEGIGPVPAKAKFLAHGHYVVQGHQLSVPGEWQLEIVGRVSRFEEVRTTVSVEVNP